MRFRRRPPDEVTQEWPQGPPEAEAPPRRRGFLRRAAGLALKAFVAYYALCVVLLVVYRFAWPPVTAVQLQRRVEAWAAGREYTVQRPHARLGAMSPHVAHAVVAAEDGRFWTHWGFDLVEMRNARRDIAGGGRMRGASTIPQQLMKNLFGCACRNPLLGGVRKLFDWTLTPVAELVLGRRRILELYLNSVEWGDGVFGVEAAARHHYHRSARELTRSQAAGLAALLPNPRRRTTRNTGPYRREILRRMTRRGW
ncbi:MAG TPA: transglycosylase domain-containing protein [Longimicrobium sp.]|nr:transglycosylase domain-containing protein [Longimicrobium sp.]